LRIAWLHAKGSGMQNIERAIETVIFYSRWVLAPFYLGLIVCLVLLFFHFVRQLVEFVLHIHRAGESDVILGVLGLIDLTFTANLIIIVIFSGYENFVSRLDAADGQKPEWMAKVDFGGLKQKLMTSVVAISAIQVLKAFMNLDKTVNTTTLGWLVGIHIVFLGSLLVLAVVDRLESGTKAKPEHR
jgi:uncharacterized protein (TIGR00645 family)